MCVGAVGYTLKPLDLGEIESIIVKVKQHPYDGAAAAQPARTPDD
ncbi:hypothetical protein [Paenibacillus terrigena]|nr:hypothetical protein [Paenibacillus terrigena]